MPAPFCHCQCKMCRAPGSRHCSSHPSCGVARARPARPDEASVGQALRLLKSGSGTHSPSVAEIERALPGLVEIDACFLSNPYATDEVMGRLRAIGPDALERMVSHYPSQSPGIASMLAPYAGVPADHLHVANGACEVLQALLARASGPLLLTPPFFSYYELSSGAAVPQQLLPPDGVRLLHL